MSAQKKLAAAVLTVIAAWLVSQTGSEKMTRACGFGVPSPCKKADTARRGLYGMAIAQLLGIAMHREEKEKVQKSPTPQPPRPPLQYGGKQ